MNFSNVVFGIAVSFCCSATKNDTPPPQPSDSSRSDISCRFFFALFGFCSVQVPSRAPRQNLSPFFCRYVIYNHVPKTAEIRAAFADFPCNLAFAVYLYKKLAVNLSDFLQYFGFS
ncbi:MAG: hypothetical protein PUE64_09845 [Firmicutes bacterium]|nr:hypothetical protein [Bacillota bacterium]